MACASFSTLPLELKARIVEMANDQEDAWWLRVKDTAEDERVGHCIDSLNALALVNKELRQLAAKYQFKHLEADQAAPPIFRFTILPLYGHHIREITFYDDDSVEGCDNALSAMGQLPALDTIRLQRTKALELFGSLQSPASEDTVESYRTRVLDLISPKIKTLVLYGFDPAEASAVVQRKLAIHISSDIESDWPPEAFAPLERDPPPINTLQLLAIPLNEEIFQLINMFASTLERLTLRPVDLVPSLDLSSITPLRLPHLTHLNLSTDKALYIKFFHLLASASTLSYLSFVHDDANVDPTDPALLSFLDSQPTLRDVNLEWFQVTDPFTPSGLIPQDPPFLAAYADLVHSRNLDPTVLDRPHLTPYHPDANLDHTRKEQPSLSQILRRTLEFGLVELDRMDAEGDVAEAVGWVPMLKPLEEKRLAWKD